MWEGEEEVWSFMLGLPPQHEGVGGTSGTPLLPAHVSWHQSVLVVPLFSLDLRVPSYRNTDNRTKAPWG